MWIRRPDKPALALELHHAGACVVDPPPHQPPPPSTVGAASAGCASRSYASTEDPRRSVADHRCVSRCCSARRFDFRRSRPYSNIRENLTHRARCALKMRSAGLLAWALGLGALGSASCFSTSRSAFVTSPLRATRTTSAAALRSTRSRAAIRAVATTAEGSTEASSSSTQPTLTQKILEKIQVS